MKISVSQLLELILKSDFSDRQVEQVTAMLRESERVLDKDVPGSKNLDLQIKRRRELFGDDWRSPPKEAKPPGPLQQRFLKVKAEIAREATWPETASPDSKPTTPDRRPS